MAHAKPTAQIWNGTTWSNEAPIVPSGSGNTVLSSVSCVSPAFCIAVGSYETGTWPTGPYFTLAEEWGRDRLVRHGDRQPERRAERLLGRLVRVLGLLPRRRRGHVGRDTLAEEWDGTSWSLMTTLDPGPDCLRGVSCETQDSSQEFCVAVGHRERQRQRAGHLGRGLGRDVVVADEHSHPFRRGPGLDGVSCLSPSFCMAVGGVILPSGTIAEEWDGTSWTLQTVPITGGRGVGGLSDVSCVSDTQCTAVGTYGGGRTGDSPRSRWRKGGTGRGGPSRRWSRRRSHVGLGVAGISCTAAAQVRCSAVGSYGGSIGWRRWPSSTSDR